METGSLEFILLEVDEDNGKYAVFDKVNGGVCYCDETTILRITEQGIPVLGCNHGTGGVYFVEYTRWGNVRKAKARNICAVAECQTYETVVQGLPKDKFPTYGKKKPNEIQNAPKETNKPVCIRQNTFYFAHYRKMPCLVFLLSDRQLYRIVSTQRNTAVEQCIRSELHDMQELPAACVEHSHGIYTRLKGNLLAYSRHVRDRARYQSIVSKGVWHPQYMQAKDAVSRANNAIYMSKRGIETAARQLYVTVAKVAEHEELRA